MTFLRSVLTYSVSALGLVLAVPILVLGAPFWVVGALTRLVYGASRLQKDGVPWQELMQFEPTIGWKPRPNQNARALADGPFRLTTDDDGWRGTQSLDSADIVVFGDSFAFGHGADDGYVFSEVHPTLRIKAIGTNGYNTVQQLLWMERLAGRLRGRLVVWFIYYGNDLYENLQPNLGTYRMPFARLEDGWGWEIVTRHVSPEPWPFPDRRRYYERLAEICSPTPLSGRAFSCCAHLIERGREVCRSVGARLVVVGIPEILQLSAKGAAILRERVPDGKQLDVGLPDRKLREICERLDVPFVALSEHLTVADYKSEDCHWNRRGQRRVADLLGEIYRFHRIRAPVPVTEAPPGDGVAATPA